MKKPLIGIVGKPSIVTDMWHYMEIVDDIRYFLIKNNALAVGLLPTDHKLEFKTDEELSQYQLSSLEKEDLKTIILRLDGVILQGGLVSNEYEEEIARICISEDIPLLGICSGFNNMIRALGGQVHIDATLFHNQFGNKIAHEVVIDQASKLFHILKNDRMLVNSIHTYVAGEEEIKEYKIAAICPLDHTVEVVELENKRFIMGIKWHPELMESMNDIFISFIEECRKTN